MSLKTAVGVVLLPCALLAAACSDEEGPPKKDGAGGGGAGAGAGAPLSCTPSDAVYRLSAEEGVAIPSRAGLATDGNVLVMIWQQIGVDGPDRVWGQAAAPGGAPLTAAYLVAERSEVLSEAIGTAGDGFVVAWTSPQSAADTDVALEAQRIGTDGLPDGGSFLLPAQQAEATMTAPVVSRSGTSALLTSMTSPEPDHRINVRDMADVEAPPGTYLFGSPDVLDVVGSHRIFPRGDQAFVVYDGGETPGVFVQTVSASGAPLAVPGERVGTTFGIAGNAHVYGDRVVVGQQDQFQEGEHDLEIRIGAVLFDQDGNFIAEPTAIAMDDVDVGAVSELPYYVDTIRRDDELQVFWVVRKQAKSGNVVMELFRMRFSAADGSKLGAADSLGVLDQNEAAYPGLDLDSAAVVDLIQVGNHLAIVYDVGYPYEVEPGSWGPASDRYLTWRCLD